MEIFHSSNPCRCCAVLQAIWPWSLLLFWLKNITGPLVTCPTWAIIFQRNLSPISLSFPPIQLFQADVSHNNYQKAFLGELSSGTLPPPQKFFSKFLWEGTMPWMTAICSWAPCVPMACFVCWSGFVTRAVAFQHTEVFLHNFFPYSSFWKFATERTLGPGLRVTIYSLGPSTLVPCGQHVMIMVTLPCSTEALWGFIL